MLRLPKRCRSGDTESGQAARSGAAGDQRRAGERPWLSLVLAVGAWALTGWWAPAALAVEEPELFLAELKARNYLDTALEYLNAIVETDLVDEEFKRSVPYERATLLTDQALTVADAMQRDKLLQEAIAAFTTFADQQPDHPKAKEVRVQVSNIYLAMAKAKLKEAERPDANKQALQDEARKLTTDAYEEAVAAEKLIQEERIPLEKEKPKGGEKKDRLDELRIAWLKSELLQATLLYELTKTYDPDSKGRKQQLTKARNEFKALAEKHEGRVPGLFARIREAQCLVELGQHKDALNTLADFLDLDDSPPLRPYKLEALRYAMEAHIGLDKPDEALKKWGIVLKGSDKSLEAAQGVQYFEAVAHRAKAAAATDPAEQQKHQEEAAKIASEMVKDASGEWQSRARELLVELGKPIEAPQELPPETFADAVSQANGAMRQRGLLKTQLEKVADDQKGEIQTKVDEQTERAFQLYRLAIALADKDTPTAQLALVYKAICYLFWDRGEHLYAAVVGDFLARQFPKDDNGKFGSWIAFNAWLVEYGKVGKDRSYEIEQLQRYGENIIKRWPDSSESVTARLQLMAFAIQDGAVDQALEYLAAIPEDNPNRGQAELTVGQALWRKYARLRRLPADEQPDPAEVDQLLSQAEKVLKEGLQRLEGGGKVDANLVGAAYSLAQLYAGTNQPVEAIALYEHPLYGPLTLVQKNDPVAVEGDYALRTYRLALRTYISALPSFQGDTAQQSAMVDKAMQMVEALEKAVEDPQNTDGTSGSGAETLTRIYIEMGSELEDQIKALVDKGDLQGRDALSKAFETFLDKIRNRETGNTYQSLIWIAETFYGLGNSNTPEPGQPTPAAQEYFRRAAETYQNILDQAEADPNFLKNPRQRTTIEMRLARCYRSLGKLQETLDRLEAILKRKTTNLPVQIEAAETLFEGGKSDCENYKNAYFGVRPGKDRKNIIWGWRRLSDITRGHEKFEQVYLLSVLYGIRCRMDLAICEGAAKPEQKTELLNAALGSLVAMHRQNPQLGGEEMRSEYDRIARKLQKELGQNEAGLEAFAQPGGPSLDDETEAEKETE